MIRNQLRHLILCIAEFFFEKKEFLYQLINMSPSIIMDSPKDNVLILAIHYLWIHLSLYFPDPGKTAVSRRLLLPPKL